MAQGTITHLSDFGYGFIDAGTGHDLIFHRYAVQNVPFDQLRRGDRVEFDIAPDPRGRGDHAVHVRRIADQPPP